MRGVAVRLRRRVDQARQRPAGGRARLDGRSRVEPRPSRLEHRPDLVLAERRNDRPRDLRAAEPSERIGREVGLGHAPSAQDLETTDPIGHGRGPAAVAEVGRPSPTRLEGQVGPEAVRCFEVRRDGLGRQISRRAVDDEGAEDIGEPATARGLSISPADRVQAWSRRSRCTRWCGIR
jgi:hypothetical protein